MFHFGPAKIFSSIKTIPKTGDVNHASVLKNTQLLLSLEFCVHEVRADNSKFTIFDFVLPLISAVDIGLLILGQFHNTFIFSTTDFIMNY